MLVDALLVILTVLFSSKRFNSINAIVFEYTLTETEIVISFTTKTWSQKKIVCIILKNRLIIQLLLIFPI